MMTRTTGIQPKDVADARTVDQVLTELDAAVPTGPLLLVAQHAPARPRFRMTTATNAPASPPIALLDTRLLAKALHPTLPSFGLDAA